MRKLLKRNAFTLIEMLIVIAIIIILGAMLAPTLNRTRESGRVARCAANLKQLQLAALNYVTDSNYGSRRLPWAYSFWHDNMNGTWSHWPGWIAWYDHEAGKTVTQSAQPNDGNYEWRDVTPYRGTSCITNGGLWSYVNKGAASTDIKSREIYLCPSMARKDVVGSAYTNAVRSYSMNSAMQGANIFNVKATMTILFGDDRNVTTAAPPLQWPYDGQFTTNEIAAWHNGKGQVVYVDGHVDKLP